MAATVFIAAIAIQYCWRVLMACLTRAGPQPSTPNTTVYRLGAANPPYDTSKFRSLAQDSRVGVVPFFSIYGVGVHPLREQIVSREEQSTTCLYRTSMFRCVLISCCLLCQGVVRALLFLPLLPRSNCTGLTEGTFKAGIDFCANVQEV